MSAAYLSAMGLNPNERSPFNQINCYALDYTRTITVIVWPEAYGKPSHAALQTYAGVNANGKKKEEWRQRNVLNEACKANGFYISFYPAITQESPCSTKACTWKEHSLHFDTEKCHYHTAETDTEGEPQKDIKIYHLNVGKDNVRRVNTAFKRHLKSPTSWNLLGSGFLRLPYQSNCSGLVLGLLESGSVRNPYKSGVNTILRTSVFAAGLGLITVGMGYGIYRQRAALVKADIAIQNVKDAAELSKKTATTAREVFEHLETPFADPDTEQLVEVSRFLLEAGAGIFIDKTPPVHQVIEEGKDILLFAAATTAVTSTLIIGGGYVLTRLLRETATPDTVARVAELAPERLGAPFKTASQCCQGEVVEVPSESQQPSSFLRPLTLGSAFLAVALTAYKGYHGSK
jgi:hypothetical protein